MSEIDIKSDRKRLLSVMWERRAKMVEMGVTDMDSQKMIDAISEQYHMPKDAVANDWYARDKWMPKLLQLDKSPESTTNTLTETFSWFMVVRSHLMKTYLTADNSNAKVGALRAIAEVLMEEVQLRLSLGLLEKKPSGMGNKSVTPSSLIDEIMKEYPKGLMKDLPDQASK